MSPNPYILLRNLFAPQRWFKPTNSASVGYTEHLKAPIPGNYEYKPGRGWYLISVDNEDDETPRLPAQVIYCRLFGRFMFKDEYESRKKYGRAKDIEGNDKVGVFFRLDDGLTWVHCWDETGKFSPCKKLQRFVVDSETGRFRVMTRADCMVPGRSPSVTTTSSTVAPVSPPGLTHSAARSFVGGDVHRPSQRSSAPSTRPGTRPSSSHGSYVLAPRNASNVTTPPSVAEPHITDLDAPELQRRLKNLNLG